jgi:hypothetical protein
MGFRPAYGVLRSAGAKGVLKRKWIGWPTYGVFGRFMMSFINDDDDDVAK